MTIKEWKEKFRKLHEEMKEDLDADTVSVYIEDEIQENFPYPYARTNIKIVVR